jgi:mRNA-degrading endonuclease toxin of MazEF toxin-antitoxin module
VNRGDVFLVSPFYFPDREHAGRFSEERTKEKFVVVLITDDPLEPEPDTVVLVASSLRADKRPEFHEVVIPSTPQGFAATTVVDCSLPYTVPRSWIGSDLRFRLREEVMHQINVKVSVMLQLR